MGDGTVHFFFLFIDIGCHLHHKPKYSSVSPELYDRKFGTASGATAMLWPSPACHKLVSVLLSSAMFVPLRDSEPAHGGFCGTMFATDCRLGGTGTESAVVSSCRPPLRANAVSGEGGVFLGMLLNGQTRA